MWIDLDRVRREPFRWRETREVPAASLERPELEALGEIDWQGEVVLAEPGFYLTGRLAYEQTLICTRCLVPFAESVEAAVELLLQIEGEREPGARSSGRNAAGDRSGDVMELDKEDLGVLAVTEERFDTDPILIEQLQLNIPMKPLCRPDCRGLCSVCGVDHNQQECSCSEQEIDPRWQALAGLQRRLADEGGDSEGDGEENDNPATDPLRDED